MQPVIDSILLFYPQLILGLLLGSVLSSIGCILVIRRMAFFGVTLSQVVTVSVAISLFFSLRNEFYIILISCLLLIPLFILQRSASQAGDTILGILFVSFTAFSQVLLSFGENIKQNILSSFFGDILTSEAAYKQSNTILLLISMVLFLLFYKKILYLSFDEDEFKVRGNSVLYVEIVFYLIITVVISISVNLLGTIYSVGQMLIPVYTALFFARSMRFLFLFSVFFGCVGTFIGFSISLLPIEYNTQSVSLPTSSTIILVLCLFSFLVLALKKLSRTVIKTV
jgi:ABC-type Mn2+/Zn2+ transport system permease subunit